MGIMHPGYFPDTYFPDRYWIDDYWADYGAPPFISGAPSISDPLPSSGTISGLNNISTITGLDSSPNIKSHKSDPTISNTLNNEGSII